MDTKLTDRDSVSRRQNQTESNTESTGTTTVYNYARNIINVSGSRYFTINQSDTNSGPRRVFNNSVSGKNVRFENENTEAKRIDGFSDGVCFISEELTKTYPVQLKIIETFHTKYGKCTMGFTAVDPSTLRAAPILQTPINEAVPESYNSFLQFQPLTASCSYKDVEVAFWYTKEGDIIFKTSRGIEQNYKLTIDQGSQLWAFLELSGPIEAIEMVSSELHDVHGTGITITEGVAKRSREENVGFVCFSKMPLKPVERFEFKVLCVRTAWMGNIRVGITETSPNLLSENSVPEYIINTNPRFRMIEISSQNAADNSDISLILGEVGVVILVNGTCTGIIPLETERTLWVVVDLFGNTMGVKIVNHINFKARISDPIRRSAEVPLVLEVFSWWIRCEILVNLLKELADASLASCQWSVEGTWNRLVETLAEIMPAGESLQMFESSLNPERIRLNCPTICDQIKSFIEETNVLKTLVMSYLQPEASSADAVTDLLGKFAQGIPEFSFQAPAIKPVLPFPSPLMLDLSMLPVNARNIDEYKTERVSKCLQKVAQKIEHAVLPLEGLLFKMYTV